MNGLSISYNTIGFKQIIRPFIKGFKTLLYKFFLFTNYEEVCFASNERSLLPDNNSYFNRMPKDEWKVRMITHWKLLESMSHKEDESLYLHVPSEEAEEFRYLIEQHQIKAIVCATSIAA